MMSCLEHRILFFRSLLSTSSEALLCLFLEASGYLAKHMCEQTLGASQGKRAKEAQ